MSLRRRSLMIILGLMLMLPVAAITPLTFNGIVP